MAFLRLIAHWRSVLPGRIHEIQYERLVADQLAETRRLLEHCGLDWEGGCLAFERNRAAVATASAAQVREPIHARAVGRWRRYERELKPIVRLRADRGHNAGGQEE